MATPLSVNANTKVEVNDSCNCCWFWRRKQRKPSEHQHDVITVTDEVYHRTIIQVERQESQGEESMTDLRSRVYSPPK